MRLLKWDTPPAASENTDSRSRIRLVRLFLVVEVCFYVWFLTSDFSGMKFLISSNAVKYASIWACFFMALSLFAAGWGNSFMILAQTLILPADFILLFADRAAAVGVLIFTGVQFCYFCRISQTHKKHTAASGLRFDLVAGIGVAALFLLSLILMRSLNLSFELLTVLAAFYISFFSVNIVCAFYEAIRFREKSGMLFVIGLILFFCCDLCVGLNFMKGSFMAGTRIAQAASASEYLMWMFYLPGQVILVLSGMRSGEKWYRTNRYST